MYECMILLAAFYSELKSSPSRCAQYADVTLSATHTFMVPYVRTYIRRVDSWSTLGR